jgi:myosin-1
MVCSDILDWIVLSLYLPMLIDIIGWWLCMSTTTSTQGWAPESYLEEQVVAAPRPAPPPPPPVAAPRPAAATNGAAAAARAKPTPPAPPAKRPAAGGRKPLALPTRDSAVSINSYDSSGGSGRATPNSSSNASLAGGLAEALRQRQSALRGSQEEEDDW